ncbi:MAG: methyl-accepting chemotaxis protein [Lachnospiraceae bacterium]|nr:methyl-accepting chemotaxis protein [Lachnospiraceae bacterium]
MKKRKSLKKLLLAWVMVFSAIIVIIITQISIKQQADSIQNLTEIVLERESISYATEIYSWWSSIEERVGQTANVIRNLPENSYDETLDMLLAITASDPDSQDVYIAYGDTGKFLDGSGWIPDDSFVFSDRAWFRGALDKKGEIYTSEPYVDASTGKTCLACAVMIRDNVVLSSDINFDMVAEKLNNFESSADNAKFYIINKTSKDILLSNVEAVVGENLATSSDALMQGLAGQFDSMDTKATTEGHKVKTIKTGAGSWMFTSTDIPDTSWVVVSAVPTTFMSSGISKTMIITFISAAVLLGIFAVVLYFLLSKFINPVTKVTKGVADITGGDFTVKLTPEGNNEITTLSESMNEYIANMRATLQNLADISTNMNASAGECFDISHNLSDSNQSQGESIEKLNSILSDMNDSIDDIARAATDLAATSSQLSENADTIKDLCNETLESSTAGKNEMVSMTENVSTLNDTIKELTELIRTTAKSIEEITGITDAINAISEQTNLLSLNASIEAARAGEAGRGFAVVASEVGALAQQSTEATVTIRNLIGSITKNIEDINRKADTCAEDMEACMAGVESANKSFVTIYDDVAKATEGIIDIADGIEKINDVASNNAATTQEQASTITEILSLSDRIVSESNKLMAETENIANVSANLNEYSEAIKSDLSQYNV